MDTPTCERCGNAGARKRPIGGAVTCDACWTGTVKTFVQELAKPQNDPRAGSPGTCKKCGTPATWHQTTNGRWMLLELDEHPIGKVPHGKRWRVAGDGTAVNLRNSSPTDECCVSHFDVCPARPAPTGDPFLLKLWFMNGGVKGSGE